VDSQRKVPEMIPPLNNISIAVGMRDKPSNIGGTATIGVDRVLQGSGLDHGIRLK